MTALVERNPRIDDLLDSVDPQLNLLKHVSELDLFALFIVINFPSFCDTIFLLLFCGFLDLIDDVTLAASPRYSQLDDRGKLDIGYFIPFSGLQACRVHYPDTAADPLR